MSQTTFDRASHTEEAAAHADEGPAPAAWLQRRQASAAARGGQAHAVRAALQRAAIPRAGGGEVEGNVDPHQIAAGGLAGGARPLPHRDPIQRAFGSHDVSNIQAHVGGPAAEASTALGARAYATGNHVAFSREPDLHTAAHEAAHVVQQRGGVQLAGGVGRVGDRYEQHADAVADRVVRGESAQELLDPMSGGSGASGVQAKAGLQFKEALGDLTYSVPARPSAVSAVTIHVRTVAEWKRFLSEQADGGDANVELNAFMARALGQTRLSGMSLGVNTDISQIEAPSATQAVDLMVAFLTVGEGIDLPDGFTEGNVFFKRQLGPLMAEFNSRFAPQALVRMSQGGEFRSRDFDSIKAYAGDAADVKDTAGGSTADPNQRLIAAALGTAVGGAQKVLDAGDDPSRNTDKSAGYVLIGNGAKTIAACLERVQEDKATQKTVLLTAFKMGAGLASGLVGDTGGIVIGVLSPVAEEFLGALLSGDGKQAARKLEDDFGDAIHKLESEHGMDATDARVVRNTFTTRMNY